MAALPLSVAAASAAGFAYLDGRYNLREDWRNIRARERGKKMFAQAIKDKRLSLYYFIEKHALANPDEESVWSREGTYTRGQALHRIHQYAQFFLSKSVKPGDLVAFFMANSPEFPLVWAGLWAIGAAPALINHNLTSQALLHCLSLSTASLIVSDGSPDLLSRLSSAEPPIPTFNLRTDVIPNLDANPARPPDSLRDPTVGPNSPFGLFYTSGTTGLPKACVIPVADLYLHAVARECGYAVVKGGPPDPFAGTHRYYDCMPLYHGTGGVSGMTMLTQGHTLCVAPKFSVRNFWDDVRESRATWFVYVGETLRYLLAAPESPRDRDHNIRGCYGNGLRPDVWGRFQERFGIEEVFEFFNSTEGIMPLGNMCRGEWRTGSVGFHGALQRWRLRNVYAAVGVDGETGDMIREDDGKGGKGMVIRKSLEEGGEILVRQPVTLTPPFQGYFRNEKATEAKYVNDVFEKGDRWYRTGDALRRDNDGRWYFLDRLGDTFRWKGENVSTAEVSETLGRFPGVVEATVYGVQIPGHDGKAGMVAVYLGEGGSDNAFDYRGFLSHARTHLPKYAVPVFVRRIKTRAASHNNKQDKAPLKKAGIDPKEVGDDPLLWIEGNGKGDTYIPFTQKDLDLIQGGRAKL